MALLSRWRRRRSPGWARRGILLAVALLLAEICIAYASPASGDGSIEYRVKAAMLYNFTRFISWPDDDSEELRLCVVGKNPFGSALSGIQGKPVKDRVMSVHRGVAPDALEQCHLVFVSRSLGQEIPRILQRLDGRPVVTVSEGGEFAEEGGTIGLVLSQGKVRFDINVAGTERRGVHISSKLLRLARRVHSEGTP